MKVVKGVKVNIGDVLELNSNNLNAKVKIKRIMRGALGVQVLNGALKGNSYSIAIRTIENLKKEC